MMKWYTLITSLLCLMVTSATLAQQREVIIETGGLNAIQAAIESDLLANDTATVEATKYVLRRDAIYPYETQWEPAYQITLVAEDGDGKRPVMLGVHPASGEAPRFIRVYDSFTFKGIEFAGLDSAGEHTDNAPIRPRGEGSRVWVEDCIIDFQRFEVMRTDQKNLRVFFMNNIVRNNFQRDRWTKSGGMWFQRGNVVDTIVFRDNTYFNTTSRMFHDINNAGINYFEFSNNTVVNAGGLREFDNYGGVNNTSNVDFGVALNLVCENNIFYNLDFFGIRTEWAEEQFTFNLYHTDSTESIIIRNNNIYTDPELLANLPDTAVNVTLRSPDLDSIIALDTTIWANNISEALTFNNAPMSIDIFKQAKIDRWADPETSFLQSLELDNSIDNYQINFGYSPSSASATAGTDGNPLGSSRWWDSISKTKDYDADPSALKLHPNFPNPLRTSTTLRFDLSQSAKIQAIVYDLNGRIVHRSALQHFAPGAGQNMSLDHLDLSAGIYTYRLLADMNGKKIGASAKMIVK